MATAEITETDEEALPRSKPPFLRRVQIRGYKSISFCDVTLEPLTVFVGRNGSGKSNLLDALAFLRDSLEISATEAVRRHGGWRTIASRCVDKQAIEFEIDVHFCCSQKVYQGNLPSHSTHSVSPNICDRTLNAKYYLRIIGDENGVPIIYREILGINDESQTPVGGFEMQRGDTYGRNINDPPPGQLMHGAVSCFEWRDVLEASVAPEMAANSHRVDHCILPTIGFQPYLDLADGLRNIGFYNFQPDAMRRPQKPIPWRMLDKDGRNIASAIRGLRERDPHALQRLKQYVVHIVPEINDFSVHEYGEFEVIRFLMNSKLTDKTLDFDAESMSDGTLRVLGGLVAVFQNVAFYGFPSVVGIEEPETALHPAAMNALVDALDEATLRTQVLITTHSAELLDNPTITPQNVRVVQMINGETQIAPVDSANVEIVRRKLNTLGGLERENRLDGDLDDLDRQRSLSNGKEVATP